MKIHSDLFTLLQYDSLFNVLTLHERIIIHMIHMGKYTRDQLTENHIKWLKELSCKSWVAPEIKYDVDFSLKYWDGDTWLSLSKYKSINN